MANAIKWVAGTAYSTAIDGTASGLRNMANDARVIGAAIDNATAKDQKAAFELYVDMASAPSANGAFNLYLIYSLDGTNFANGDASVVPAPNTLKLVFPVQPNTNQQRIVLADVDIAPFKFKCLLENKSGQATTNANDTDNILSYATYNSEIQ